MNERAVAQYLDPLYEAMVGIFHRLLITHLCRITEIGLQQPSHRVAFRVELRPVHGWPESADMLVLSALKNALPILKRGE